MLGAFSAHGGYNKGGTLKKAHSATSIRVQKLRSSISAILIALHAALRCKTVSMATQNFSTAKVCRYKDVV